MMKKIDNYTVGQSDSICVKQAFFGCRNTLITLESKSEKLPFRNTETGLTITADAIIDNRKELFDLFGIPMSDRASFTDSQLILLAYMKWKEKCPEYLIGDYSFAIFNEETEELFCARDHMGKRTFYYFLYNNCFAFSTMIEPLFSLGKLGKEINESWLVHSLSFLGPLHEVDCTKTVYSNIMQLIPANTLIVKNGYIKTNKYWVPYKKNELRLKSDSEYEEAFREVFFEAVKCRLRADGEVGVLLSGGLDSGSVASVAARQLGEKGKRLKAYSFIPFSGYKDNLPNTLIADESSYIQSIVNKTKNIDIKFLQFNEKNSVSDIDLFINILEQPFKTIHNLLWIYGIIAEASLDGCKVILNGQVGNSTISFGSMITHFSTLLKKFRLLTFSKDVGNFCKIQNQDYFDFSKRFIRAVLPENIMNMYRKFRGTYKANDFPVPVNTELSVKYNTLYNLKKIGIPSPNIYDIDSLRNNMMLQPPELSQIGMIETKLPLSNSIQIRDPSGDKRVVDFCFSIPEEQFVKGYIGRSLIRRAMTGLLPDDVRLNQSVRGRQSADWIQRLEPSWGNIQADIKKMTKNKEFAHYINIDKIISALNLIGKGPTEKFSNEVYMLLISYITGMFLEKKMEE